MSISSILRSFIGLLPCLLLGLLGSHKAQAQLQISLSPASTTYTAGQSVTVTITGGTPGTHYSLLLYEGDPTLGQLRTVYSSEDSQGNNTDGFTWASGQTSAVFYIRFGAGSVGENRVFEVADDDLNEAADTDIPGFTVLPQPTLTLTLSPALTTYSVGQLISATLTGGIVGETYSLLLYNGTPAYNTDITNFMSVTSNQGNSDAIYWADGTTSGQFTLRFKSGAVGTNRTLEVTSQPFLHLRDIPNLTIICPTVSISVTPSLTIASGGSVTLTASGATSYTWSNGVQSNSMVLTNVTSATTLSVTGVTGGCSSTASAVVSVTQAPAVPCVYTPTTISVAYVTGGIDGFAGPSLTPAPYLPNGKQSNLPKWTTAGTPPTPIYTIAWSGFRWEIKDNTGHLIAHATGSTPTNLPCSQTNWVMDDTEYADAIYLTGGCGSLLPPSLTVTATPSLTVTSGGSVTLTASGASTYTWSNGVHSNSVILTNVTSATTLSVTGITATNCSLTASAAVSVTTAPGAVSVCVAGGCPDVNGTYVESNLPTWSYGELTIVRALKNTTQNSYLLFVSSPPESGEPVSQWVIAWYNTESETSSSRYGASGSVETIPTEGWESITENSACTPITVTMGACVVCSLTVGIAAVPSTITAGGSVTLTASGATSYTWSNGMSGSAITVSNITSATTLSVTGTTGQCSATASAAIAVSVACDPTIVAHAYSLTQTAVLGPNNCSVQLTGTGYGTGYVITGPGGYVFSAVYRNVGAYTIRGLDVKLPGTYTLTVSYANACGQPSYETITYLVTGTACR